MSGTSGDERIILQAVAKRASQITQIAGDYYAAAELLPASATVSLPPGPEPLAGRDELVEELLDLLSAGHDDRQRVVTVVTGLPGVGKTALAVHTAHLAHEVKRWFDGGVLFADMRGYDPAGQVSCDQVLSRWLRDLGTRDDDIPVTSSERVGRYRSRLNALAEQGHRVLLVADNAASADQVRPLVPPRGEHRLLVTSREALVTLPARQLAIAHLDPDAATALIAETLRRVWPEDTRPAAESADLAQLAALCGGLPLALEIAAQVLAGDPGLSIARVAWEIEREIAVTGGQHVSQRLGPTWAAFALSYQRLSATSARTFRLLALNPGPEVATETVAALINQSVHHTRELLAGLARASLLTEQPAGSGWWQLHDLMHTYATDRVARECTEEEVAAARKRLLRHYTLFTFAATHQLDGEPDPAAAEYFPDRTSALEWLDRECDNLVAAVNLGISADAPVTAGESPTWEELTGMLAVTLAPYLRLRFHFDELQSVSEAAAGLARECEDVNMAYQALQYLGQAQSGLGQFEAAIISYRQLEQLARREGNRQAEATALAAQGVSLRKLRRFDEALTTYSKASAIYSELGDLSGEASMLNAIGVAQGKQNLFEAAAASYRAAGALCRQAGDRVLEATTLVNLAGILVDLGRLQGAIDAGNEALAIYDELGSDDYEAGKAWHNIGTALRRARHFEGAAVFVLQRAVTAYKNAGDQHGAAQALNSLGLALATRRRSRKQAVQVQREAIDLFYATHDQHEAAKALTAHSMVLGKLRHFDEAIEAAHQSAAAYRSVGDLDGEAGALIFLGIMLANVRRYEDAAAAFERAQHLRKIDNKGRESFAIYLLSAARKKQRWRILLAAKTIRV